MLIYSNIERHAAQLGFKAKVVACAEINPDRLKKWGEQYGFEERTCTPTSARCWSDDIDVIDVCVHNNLHPHFHSGHESRL